jgi:transcriptional regulator with XRE-family HTH domain
MWTERTNSAILKEIAARLKEYRLRRNLQQKEVAENAGVSLDTVARFERGESITLEKFLRILRVLDMLENIEAFIPEPPPSPILLRKLQGKKRYRVRN